MTSPKKGLDIEKESTLFGDLTQLEVIIIPLRNKLKDCLNIYSQTSKALKKYRLNLF